MHQRIRAVAPVLPALVRATERRRRHAEALLEAIASTPVGAEVRVQGRRYRRERVGRPGGDPDNRSLVALDLDGDADAGRVSVVREEDNAFWAWAAVEVLRLTGIRNEELPELTHLSVRRGYGHGL